MYNSEDEYNYALYCEAEAEAENAAAEAHFNYMNELIERKEYEIYALEYCLNLLSSKSFKRSNLEPIEYFNKMLNSFRIRANIREEQYNPETIQFLSKKLSFKKNETNETKNESDNEIDIPF